MTQAVWLWIKARIRFFVVLFKNQSNEEKSHKSEGGRDATLCHVSAKELLHDLDAVFDGLDKLKPKRSDAQKVLNKLGPYVAFLGIGDDALAVNQLESFDVYGFPSFLIRYHRRPSGDFIESFTCAIKSSRLGGLYKQAGHSYYEVTTVVLLDRDKPKWIKGNTYEVFYYVKVNETTGKVTALKMPIQTIYGGQIWRYPPLPFDGPGPDKKLSQEETKRELERGFTLTYNIVMRREYGINIRAKKGKRKATFTIPHGQWKQFFRDRFGVVTQQGHKAPIFHAVTAHTRTLKNGKRSSVRTHYRGSRLFLWNGYQIKIILPGKHGMSQAFFNLPAQENLPKEVSVGIRGMADCLEPLFEQAPLQRRKRKIEERMLIDDRIEERIQVQRQH